MKTAVVFYSLDGNCALIAEAVKTQLNAELIRLQIMGDKKRRSFFKMLWGIGMMLSRKKPPLKPYTFDPAVWDLIIIGTPVWAGSPAPPLQTFLSQTSITGKKIALFVCHAGGKGDALEKLKALLPGNEIAAETDFTNPVKSNSEEVNRQVAEWVKSFGDL